MRDSLRFKKLREWDIKCLEHLVTGKTDEEIANELHVSPITVTRNFKRLRSELEIGTRTELAVWWTKWLGREAGKQRVDDIAALLERQQQVLGPNPHIFQVAEWIRGRNQLPEREDGRSI